MRTGGFVFAWILAFVAGWLLRETTMPTRLAPTATSPADVSGTTPDVRRMPRLETPTRTGRTARRPHTQGVRGRATATVPAPVKAASPLPSLDPHLRRSRSLAGDLRGLLARGPLRFDEVIAVLQHHRELPDGDWMYSESIGTAAARYEWLQFQMAHEAELADFWIDAYRTMDEAETADALWELGALDEHLGAYLIGVLPAAKFETLRTHVRGLLRVAKHNGIRESLLPLLVTWAQAMGPAAARRALKDKDVSAVERSVLLAGAFEGKPPIAQSLEVLIEILDQERDWGRFAEAYQRLVGIDADADLAPVDAKLIEFAAASKAPMGKNLWHYLRWSGRTTWSSVEPFIDAGFEHGGHAPVHFATLLSFLSEPVPRAATEHYLSLDTLPKAANDILLRELARTR